MIPRSNSKARHANQLISNRQISLTREDLSEVATTSVRPHQPPRLKSIKIHAPKARPATLVLVLALKAVIDRLLRRLRALQLLLEIKTKETSSQQEEVVVPMSNHLPLVSSNGQLLMLLRVAMRQLRAKTSISRRIITAVVTISARMTDILTQTTVVEVITLPTLHHRQLLTGEKIEMGSTMAAVRGTTIKEVMVAVGMAVMVTSR